jgi:hypothetical protein
MEAAPRLDRRTDDDELSASLGSDPGDVLAETPRPHSDDLAAHGDAVRACHGGSGLHSLLQAGEHAVHVRVQRQLALDDERRDEDDAGAAIRRKATGEIEGVLGLLAVEQWHDDAPVRDRARPVREPPRPAPYQPDVGQLHRRSW